MCKDKRTLMSNT